MEQRVDNMEWRELLIDLEDHISGRSPKGKATPPRSATAATQSVSVFRSVSASLSRLWSGSSAGMSAATQQHDQLDALSVRFFSTCPGCRARGESNGDDDGGGGGDGEGVYAPEHVASVLEVIAHYLHMGGIQEMGKRPTAYKAVLNFCEDFLFQPCVQSRLMERRRVASSDGGGSSVSELLESFAEKAALYVVLNAPRVGGEEEEAQAQAQAQVRAQAHAQAGSDDEAVGLAKTVLALRQRLRSVAAASPYTPTPAGTGGDGKTGTGSSSEDSAESVEAREYELALRPLCFALGEGVAQQNFFWKKNKELPHVSNPRLRNSRLRKELADLAANLPLFPSPICVRVDEERNDFLVAIIIGPEDTPYAGGVWQFDIWIGSGFPSVPPSVKFMTTDSARVRFNPNLYKGGKVCLSLLGTWSGPGWDPEHSSILQVLVSIQSLILNSEPYFNEPGFQALVGTRAGTEASHHYNMEVREGTLRVAVLGASLYPPLCMAAVVQEHFTRRAAAYLRQLDDWDADLKAGWAQGKTGSSYMDSMHVQASAVMHRAQAMSKVIATLRKRFTKFKASAAT